MFSNSFFGWLVGELADELVGLAARRPAGWLVCQPEY